MISVEKKKKILQYIAAIICLAFIARYFVVHKDDLAQLKNIKIEFILSLSFLYFTIFLLIALKMLIVLRKFGLKNLSLFSWFKVYVVSRFVNSHITQGGNLYRALKLKKDHQFPYTNSIGTLTLFTWFETLFVLIFSLIILCCIDIKIFQSSPQILWALLIAIFSLITIPFLGKPVLDKLNPKNPGLVWIHEKVTTVVENLMSNYKDRRLIANFIFLSLLIFIIHLLIINTSFLALGVSLPLSMIILFSIITQLSGQFSITPGNLGITEMMWGYLAEVLGNSFGQGILACAILRVVLYLVTLFLTILFIRTLSPNKIINTTKT